MYNVQNSMYYCVWHTVTVMTLSQSSYKRIWLHLCTELVRNTATFTSHYQFSFAAGTKCFEELPVNRDSSYIETYTNLWGQTKHQHSKLNSAVVRNLQNDRPAVVKQRK